MKLLHCADVHLGSKIQAKLPREKAEERRREVRLAFKKMVDFAESENCAAIILAGDVFDSARPSKTDKEFFYGIVKAHPGMDFLYLRGNHDDKQSYVEMPDNLKTFTDEWTCYDYGQVKIFGTELGSGNEKMIYSTLNAPKDSVNIVVLHGQVGSGQGLINPAKFAGKNVDYLALGHLHTAQGGKIDARGRYAYSGCLEGRGFDEAGVKGYVLLEADNGNVTDTFVPSSIRQICSVEVDVSAAADSGDMYRVIGASLQDVSPRDILEIVLVGEVTFDTSEKISVVEEMLSDDYYFVRIKDKTRRKVNLANLVADKTIKGEFVRTVLALGLSDAETNAVLAAGLDALSGYEVER